jgi:hypothetical protein
MTQLSISRTFGKRRLEICAVICGSLAIALFTGVALTLHHCCGAAVGYAENKFLHQREDVSYIPPHPQKIFTKKMSYLG